MKSQARLRQAGKEGKDEKSSAVARASHFHLNTSTWIFGAGSHPSAGTLPPGRASPRTPGSFRDQSSAARSPPTTPPAY